MLLNLLGKIIAEYPEKNAIEFGNNNITYQKLDEVITKLANGLTQLGIKKGDRIVILLPNTPHFVFAYYAILKIGAIIVPLNMLLTMEEYQSIFIEMEPSAIIVWDKFIRQHNPLFDEYDNVLVLGNVANKYKSLTKLIASAPVDDVDASLNGDDTVLIQYSPGIESTSNAIELSYENISEASLKFSETFSTDNTDRYGSLLPLFLIITQNMIMNPALIQGATVVLYPKINRETLGNAFFHDNITVLPGSPSIFEMICRDPREIINTNSYSLKYALSIGTLCPAKILNRFEEKFNVPILEGYGVIETSGLMSFNRDLPDRKIGTIGLPLNGIIVKIVDDEGLELAPGEIGEIVVSGKNVMKGYYNQADKTNSVIREGLYFTGDIGKIDEEGFLYLIDRKADVITKSGFHIYPNEIENILSEHPKIDQIAVLGIKHPAYGQEVKACIVLKEGENVTVDEIIEFCKEKVPVYKCPQIIQFYKSLPRSSTGKIIRRKLYEHV